MDSKSKFFFRKSSNLEFSEMGISVESLKKSRALYDGFKNYIVTKKYPRLFLDERLKSHFSDRI